MKKADELGRDYNAYSDQIDDLTCAKDTVTSKIKAVAKASGRVDGKQTTITGDKFVIGFTTTDPGEDLDSKKLRKVIGKKVWLQITSRVLNNAKLEAAIKSGLITRTTLTKCMVPSAKKPQKRVIVREINIHDVQGKKKEK